MASTRDVLDGLGVGAVGKKIAISVLRQRKGEGEGEGDAESAAAAAAAAQVITGASRGGRVGPRSGAGVGASGGGGFAFGDVDKWEAVELTVVPTALPQ